MVALSDYERLLVGVSLAADRRPLERVAGMVLDRGDAVTELLQAAGADDDEAWRRMRDVCARRGGTRSTCSTSLWRSASRSSCAPASRGRGSGRGLAWTLLRSADADAMARHDAAAYR